MSVDEQAPSPDEQNSYGAALKEARTAAGLSQTAMGELIPCSESLVGLIERGKRKPTRQFTLAAETALDLNGELLRLLPGTKVVSAPKWFREWPRVEENAHTIRTWQPLVVPGLLQTAAYARAILSAEPGVTQDWIEETVETRLQRQAVFDRNEPPMYWALLDECALIRPIGGADVMREQLEHLLKMMATPFVSIQIVPLSVGATPGLLGGFAFAQGAGMPDHISLEDAAQGSVTDREEIVRKVSLRYDAIHKWAHPIHVSERLVREVAAKYED
jgi:transcriptional regulator with XRE-family HTH domain